MRIFLCSCATPDLTLTEHIDFKWLTKSELMGLDWAGADELNVSALREPERPQHSQYVRKRMGR
jgi:hypothetical protein